MFGFLGRGRKRKASHDDSKSDKKVPPNPQPDGSADTTIVVPAKRPDVKQKEGVLTDRERLVTHEARVRTVIYNILTPPILSLLTGKEIESTLDSVNGKRVCVYIERFEKCQHTFWSTWQSKHYWKLGKVLFQFEMNQTEDDPQIELPKRAMVMIEFFVDGILVEKSDHHPSGCKFPPVTRYKRFARKPSAGKSDIKGIYTSADLVPKYTCAVDLTASQMLLEVLSTPTRYEFPSPLDERMTWIINETGIPTKRSGGPFESHLIPLNWHNMSRYHRTSKGDSTGLTSGTISKLGARVEVDISDNDIQFIRQVEEYVYNTCKLFSTNTLGLSCQALVRNIDTFSDPSKPRVAAMYRLQVSGIHIASSNLRDTIISMNRCHVIDVSFESGYYQLVVDFTPSSSPMLGTYASIPPQREEDSTDYVASTLEQVLAYGTSLNRRVIQRQPVG